MKVKGGVSLNCTQFYGKERKRKFKEQTDIRNNFTCQGWPKKQKNQPTTVYAWKDCIYFNYASIKMLLLNC